MGTGNALLDALRENTEQLKLLKAKLDEIAVNTKPAVGL